MAETVPARPAASHELVKGAVIRVPAGPGFYARPFGLEIAWRDPTSKETGAFRLGGYVLAQDGTTARRRRPVRAIAIVPGFTPPVTLIRKAPPREFTAKIATLACPSPDPELGPALTTRWGIVDSEGNPLPGKGTGPAIIQLHCGSEVRTWTLAGDWEGKPTPWLAKELAEKTPEEHQTHRDPIEQCIDRVRQERGILHVERLTYDLSVWHHDPVMVISPGDSQWHATRTCKRCGRILRFETKSPWWFAADDGDTECHGEVWVP